MASTRAATGNSKPRVFPTVSTEPVRKTTTGKKTTKKTTTGRVAKPATTKSKPSVKDKVAGTAKKAAGAVEGKPAKKAAGAKQAKGTDTKSARGRKAKV